MAFDLSTLAALLKGDTTKTAAKAGVLGIDIGSSAIKFVQLREVKGIPTLETYGELQLGPYEGIDMGRSTHLPQSKVIEALGDILREGDATATDGAFALSYNSSLTTTISVPTLDPEKIGSMIPVEAKKYIPISLTKIDLEWFALRAHESERTTEVFLSAIYHDARIKYESIMSACGLTSIAHESEIFSSIRSVLSPADELVAILDFGASSTRLYIVKKGVVVKTHSVLLSSAELTNALVEALGVEFALAEEQKRTVGMQGDAVIRKSLTGALERDMRELHMVLKHYEEENDLIVAKIIMSGAGAGLKGLATYTQDVFSLPVVLAEPFSKVAYPAFLGDILKEAGPSFAVALGVALRVFQKTE